jgi:hypothetical protein
VNKLFKTHIRAELAQQMQSMATDFDFQVFEDKSKAKKDAASVGTKLRVPVIIVSNFSDRIFGYLELLFENVKHGPRGLLIMYFSNVS